MGNLSQKWFDEVTLKLIYWSLTYKLNLYLPLLRFPVKIQKIWIWSNIFFRVLIDKIVTIWMHILSIGYDIKVNLKFNLTEYTTTSNRIKNDDVDDVVTSLGRRDAHSISIMLKLFCSYFILYLFIDCLTHKKI